MTVYVLAQFEIHDRDRYQRYVDQFAATLIGFEGRLLVADECVDLLHGDWPFDKAVLIEFSDASEARRWATSDSYTAIATDRLASTAGPVVLLHGRSAAGSR